MASGLLPECLDPGPDVSRHVPQSPARGSAGSPVSKNCERRVDLPTTEASRNLVTFSRCTLVEQLGNRTQFRVKPVKRLSAESLAS